MSGLHNTQTFPATPRWADLFKSADVPWAGNSCSGADAAAVVLRYRLEALASQLAELDALRERVHQAEQRSDRDTPNETRRYGLSEDERALAPARLIAD